MFPRNLPRLSVISPNRRRSTHLFCGPRLGLIIAAGLIASALSIESVSASTFVEASDGLDQPQKGETRSRFSARGLPREVDRTGRTFYAIDDMRFPAAAEAEDAFTGILWPGGTVYYQFDPGVTFENRQAWADAAAAWSAVADLTFVESTGAGDYILVQNSNQNSSFVGRVGGEQVMNIASWSFKYIIAHEIAHALGQVHEQCRSDRDTYVTIFFQNIEAGKEPNFEIIPSAVEYGPYDFDSVMHYRADAFSSNGFNTIEPTPQYSAFLDQMGQRNSLSQLDAEGMAQRYGGSAPTVANDNFANRLTLPGVSGAIEGNSSGATKESGEPNHAGNTGGKSLWYSWTAAGNGVVTINTVQSGFDTLLAVYTGGGVAQLSLVASNDDISQSSPQSTVTFQAAAGVDYHIAVDGYSGAAGALRLQWNLAVSGSPANDRFADRQVLSGQSGSVSGSNAGATKEASEPEHGFNAGGASVWYSWTASENGLVTFHTRGSNFDTLLAAYRGTLGSLTSEASNDDSGDSVESSIGFPATAGTTYHIAVDGYDGVVGAIALEWSFSAASSVSANDSFAQRQSLSGTSGSTSGTNLGATLEGGEPDHAGVIGGASVWFAWTAPGDGAAAFSTTGSNFDTVIAVYRGVSLGGLTPIASNDDDPRGGRTSFVNFSVENGVTYMIALDGYRGDSGEYALTWGLGASASPTRLGNISTRLRVGTGENVLIAGIIISGSSAKPVIVRALGPSLPVGNPLADPVLEIYDARGELVAENDDWANEQEQEILATTIPPSSGVESAIVTLLEPGLYTALLRGYNGGTGIALVEVFELDEGDATKFDNISTRGFVQPGDNAMIGGIIVLGQGQRSVIVRALGPSLGDVGVPNALPDPTLGLYDGNGVLLLANDNWRDSQESEIVATTLQPANNADAAIVASLTPGAYTAIVQGKNNASGVALVEVYAVE